MIGVISNPVKSLNSHNGGWTLITKNLLECKFKTNVDILTDKDNWNKYDVLVVNEGVNYKSGVYNFFGGVQDSTKLRLQKFNDFKGELFSLNENVNYNDMCLKRKELLDYRTIEFRIPEVIQTQSVNDSLILGDSHSLSVYKPGYSISRNDGKTLHGFLKEGLINYVSDNVDKLVFYAGNIDIRFHVMRFGIESIDNMILDLESQLKDLKLNDITLVHLLPIENESRKIPGTGKYKGENFYGNRSERLEMVIHFNKMIDMIASKNNWKVLNWSFDYSKELSFDNMEAKQSVHLRPTSYMFANDLSLTTNTLF